MIKQDEEKKLIDRLIWELIQECSIKNDNDLIKLEIGGCLGEIGIINPYIILFDNNNEKYEEINTHEDRLFSVKVNFYLTK